MYHKAFERGVYQHGWPLTTVIIGYCIVPQMFNLLPLLLYSIVSVIWFITNMKYAFVCIYLVRLSPDNINIHVIHWFKMKPLHCYK